LLTARWCIWGYYCTCALIWTAALNMLCSMLQSLCALLKDCRLSRPAALSLSLSAACVLCVCASDLVINIFYPFLRWIALLSLLGLLLFQPVSEEPSE